MNKYGMSDEQLKLVKRGLERLYYNCKDEGDSEAMRAITELEESLNREHKKNEEEHQEMLNQIHVCYLDCMDEEPTQEQINEIAVEVKKELEYEVQQWGWDDTEVADRIWNWINENIKHG